MQSKYINFSLPLQMVSISSKYYYYGNYNYYTIKYKGN